MGHSDFEIRILRQYWIRDDGKDDKDDCCSHGEVYIRIGSEELSNKETGAWSLSTAGLYLLRSLGQDCQFDEFSNQLVPCCGHMVIPDENIVNFVQIIGCPSGIDWEIVHKGCKVTFKSEKGSTAELPFDEYRNMIIEFTDQIESFYGSPSEKNVLGDDLDKDGFDQFWAEWRDLKDRWS
jgi:hypothetical protein